MATEDKKQYNSLEPVLNKINGTVIALSDDEIRSKNIIQRQILNKITTKMAEKDIMFKAMFQSIFYGGSFYDGLRIINAEEYDLDLLLRLPKVSKPIIELSNNPGFVTIKLSDIDKLLKQPEGPQYGLLKSFLDQSNYLRTDLVRNWIESLIAKTLNEFCNKIDDFSVHFRKGGPAFTLKVIKLGSSQSFLMDIDLVPCFLFSADKWPKNGIRPNPVPHKPEFFVVPKSPKTSLPVSTRFWRLSFQEQERVLINGKRTLKPTIKLLKKLRDREGQVAVASYYIKTLVLLLLEQRPDVFDTSLSWAFIQALKFYQSKLESKILPYYWQKTNNLLNCIRDVTLENYSCRLKRIIFQIERSVQDQTFEPIVCDILLTEEEWKKLMKEGILPDNSNCFLL